ncbi:integrase catalytic subunit, partial [Mycolicibacterium fortuitum subsp. acetamidolyticum]
AGPDHPQAGRGQQAARDRPGTCGGVPALGGHRVDVASLGGPVRRHEGQRRQATQGARGRERPAQEVGRQPGPRHRHAQRDLGGKLL